MKRAVCFALLLAAMPVLRAHAQGIDLSHGGPVDVTASGGFEWREQEQKVIANGDARAVRDNVTVLADRLIALYRKRPNAANGGASATNANAGANTGPNTGPNTGSSVDSGGNEVYRLEAEGHVRIVTPTDEAVGDHAIYDIDQAVLVMTGKGLRLTTPNQVITARDSMEYWSDKRMAVARGAAVVVTSDGRRVSADTLVGYMSPPDAPAAGVTQAGVTQAGATQAAAKPGDPAAASGKLQRVEGFGNVEVRTTTDTVRGDRGVYVVDAGLARVIGHVRVTHGENQINGPAADVNMKTGVARMIADPGSRVQGMIMPNDAQSATSGAAAPPGAKPGGKAAPKAAP